MARDDPEPEFVDINANNEIAVTLQENNHIVIHGATGNVVSTSLPARSISRELTPARRCLTFHRLDDGPAREPDAVQWIDADRLVVANEGDYEGGSRGFTIIHKTGDVLLMPALTLNTRSPCTATIPNAATQGY